MIQIVSPCLQRGPFLTGVRRPVVDTGDAGFGCTGYVVHDRLDDVWLDTQLVHTRDDTPTNVVKHPMRRRSDTGRVLGGTCSGRAAVSEDLAVEFGAGVPPSRERSGSLAKYQLSLIPPWVGFQ